MFSPDKSVRQSSIEKLKYISGLQFLLGLGILVCAIVAVVIKDAGEYFNNYFIGGFTCGGAGALAGICGMYTVYKASSFTGDDVGQLRRELQFTACFQMILGYIVFFMSMSGFITNILFLINDEEDEIADYKTHVILSACILSGIILLLIVSIFAFMTMGTCCQHNRFNFNQTRTHNTCQNTVGGTQFNQGQPSYGQQQVYSTGGFNQGTSQPVYPPPYQSLEMGQKTQYGFQPSYAPNAPPPPYPY